MDERSNRSRLQDSTNYKAEAQALKTAATMLVEQREAIQNKVVNFSDALSVMQALSNPQNKELNVISSAVSDVDKWAKKG